MGKKDLLSQKIVLSEAPPPPLTQDNDAPSTSKEKKGPNGLFKKLSKRVLQILSNLPLAIGEMFTIAFLMGLGMYQKFSSFFCLHPFYFSKFYIGHVWIDLSLYTNIST